MVFEFVHALFAGWAFNITVLPMNKPMAAPVKQAAGIIDIMIEKIRGDMACLLIKVWVLSEDAECGQATQKILLAGEIAHRHALAIWVCPVHWLQGVDIQSIGQ